MSYESAREQYAKIGVDTDRAIAKMRDVHLSMHCWQGDDVSGFEGSGELTRRDTGDRQLSRQSP